MFKFLLKDWGHIRYYLSTGLWKLNSGIYKGFFPHSGLERDTCDDHMFQMWGGSKQCGSSSLQFFKSVSIPFSPEGPFSVTVWVTDSNISLPVIITLHVGPIYEVSDSWEWLLGDDGWMISFWHFVALFFWRIWFRANCNCCFML